ncbi:MULTISPECIES: S1C family serine protease [Pyrobaculum]|uniref:Peptidase S1 and S6, chymotrypsin/Hap n=3 Tax=Pyrobaculum TaxID=2276 RepID=A4WJ82_PYRAR|nr:trypsin-like peptidase domain-containing protein [Pyrobaculum arsenaticum]ABP50449.1 peptidase S1 and S6, chymotrypsin/Hap [Pyrobaculum arsenaticum DSM 13514]MCY0890441.1 trypsin-like peptidase domain-containing protein [Pyrobaculum arsenaticum]NYR14609.1 trypsin-like serine protease [Pyrobaculum arsenaticum]
MDISGLVEKVAESVVAVVTRPYEAFPGDFGFGTAFAIDTRFFATAYHVVVSAEEMALVTPEGEKAEGRVVVADPAEDVALIYSELRAPPLRMGSALRLKVGQGVVAIGYPLALLDKPTATFGIVSAVGRTLRAGDRVFEYLIQTDAAINPGNSGGPLVNMEGEAVGVNSAIIAGAQNLGFAVPIDIVRIAYEMYRKYGKYVRPALGIYLATLNKAAASLYGIPVEKGLLVVDVVPGSPAEEIGIERGDVIIRVDGREVHNVFELRLHVAEAVINRRRPSFEVWRRGRRVEL